MVSSTANDNNMAPLTHLGFTSQQWRSLALTISITGLVAGTLAIVFYGVLPQQGAWAGYPESVEGLCEQFCESSDQCDLTMAERPPVFQPINAWTGMTFLLFGLWPILNRFDLSTVAFLLGNVYVGLGSFMFHASLAEFWGDVDVAGTIALISTAACHGLHSVFGISWRWMVLPIMALAICTNFFYPQMKSVHLILENQMSIIISIMVLTTLRLAVARIQQMRQASKSNGEATSQCLPILQFILYASLPGILFALGLAIWFLENGRVFCNPRGFIQGHGFWHVLSAISIFLNWQFLDQNRLADIQSCNDDKVEVLDETVEISVDDIYYSDIELGLSIHHKSSDDLEMGLTSDYDMSDWESVGSSDAVGGSASDDLSVEESQA